LSAPTQAGLPDIAEAVVRGAIDGCLPLYLSPDVLADALYHQLLKDRVRAKVVVRGKEEEKRLDAAQYLAYLYACMRPKAGAEAYRAAYGASSRLTDRSEYKEAIMLYKQEVRRRVKRRVVMKMLQLSDLVSAAALKAGGEQGATAGRDAVMTLAGAMKRAVEIALKEAAPQPGFPQAALERSMGPISWVVTKNTATELEAAALSGTLVWTKQMIKRAKEAKAPRREKGKEEKGPITELLVKLLAVVEDLGKGRLRKELEKDEFAPLVFDELRPIYEGVREAVRAAGSEVFKVVLGTIPPGSSALIDAAAEAQAERVIKSSLEAAVRLGLPLSAVFVKRFIEGLKISGVVSRRALEEAEAVEALSAIVTPLKEAEEQVAPIVLVPSQELKKALERGAQELYNYFLRWLTQELREILQDILSIERARLSERLDRRLAKAVKVVPLPRTRAELIRSYVLVRVLGDLADGAEVIVKDIVERYRRFVEKGGTTVPEDQFNRFRAYMDRCVEEVRDMIYKRVGADVREVAQGIRGCFNTAINTLKYGWLRADIFDRFFMDEVGRYLKGLLGDVMGEVALDLSIYALDLIERYSGVEATYKAAVKAYELVERGIEKGHRNIYDVLREHALKLDRLPGAYKAEGASTVERFAVEVARRMGLRPSEDPRVLMEVPAEEVLRELYMVVRRFERSLRVLALEKEFVLRFAGLLLLGDPLIGELEVNKIDAVIGVLNRVFTDEGIGWAGAELCPG